MSASGGGNRPHSHSPSCENCGDEALKSAAEKKARLAKLRRASENQQQQEQQQQLQQLTSTGEKRGKVALKAKVIGGRINSSKGNSAAATSDKKSPSAPGKVVNLTVKSNLGKVRVGGSVSRGHYLYGRKSGGATGSIQRLSLQSGDGLKKELPTRPSTVPCDLIITSPRKPKNILEQRGSKENIENETPVEKPCVEDKDEEEYPSDEPLFIPAKSIVNPHQFSNDDLRFLFKYGVRLPVLSGNTPGGGAKQLALVQLDDDCTPAPPPTPPPASVDEHYLIHKHFLSQLPEARLMYNEQDLELESLVDPLNCRGDHTSISELSLGNEILGKAQQHHHQPHPVTFRDSNEGTPSGGKNHHIGGGNHRAMTSFSRGSQSSVLSKMTSYSWRRQEEDRKLPQVTDDLFYRATHASPEARASFNRGTPDVNHQQRSGATKATTANCGFCQKTRNGSDCDDGSSDTSSLSNGVFRTKQLVRRINELDSMQGLSRTPESNNRLNISKFRPITRSSDDILYNQVKSSIDWLNVPRDTQTHITILGRSLNNSPTGNKTRAARLTRALMAGKDHRSAQTYLDYVENVRTHLRKNAAPQGSQRRSHGGHGSATSVASSSTMQRRAGTAQDAVDSVFACNRPISRPTMEYEEQELTATFTDDASAVDGYQGSGGGGSTVGLGVSGSAVVITGIPKRPPHSDPFLVNSLLLGARGQNERITGPPPNSPREPVTEQYETGAVQPPGPRATLRVDLRSATQVAS